MRAPTGLKAREITRIKKDFTEIRDTSEMPLEGGLGGGDMPDFLRGDGEGPNLLGGTLKVALALGALGYLAVQATSSERLDYKGLSRLAADVTKKAPEPGITGSVERSARSTRLDPCTSARRP
jgi:hypothetical protein